MAGRGMSVFTHNGDDYRINDPNIAGEFSESTAYVEGNYVNYEGDLYRFIKNHPAGSWDATHADKVEVGMEIGGVRDVLYTESGLLRLHELDLLDYSTINLWINSSNIWSTTGKSKMIPITDIVGHTITVKGNSDNGTAVCFLKSSDHTSGGMADYANGTGRTSLSAGELKTFVIPEDCAFINVTEETSGNSRRPDYINAYQSVIPEIEAQLTETVNYDLTTPPFNVYISTNDVWSPNGTSNIFDIPADAKEITVKASLDADARIAFLTKKNHTTWTAPSYATGTGRLTVDAGLEKTYSVPASASYLYVARTYTSDGETYDRTPQSASFTRNKTIAEAAQIPLGLHTMPDNSGVLNVIKRCRQLTDIRWTPAVNLPRCMQISLTYPTDSTYKNANNEIHRYEGTFLAGKEYRGVPYGRCDALNRSPNNYGYDRSSVGMDVSFETFLTAVQNSESIISKQDLSSLEEHRSIPYAGVCSDFVCYALGLSTHYSTVNIPSIPGLNIVDANNPTVGEIDINKIKLADVLNYYDDEEEHGHVVIVTDLVKDEFGANVFFEVSETTTRGEANPDYTDGTEGGTCRRIGYSAQDFIDAHSSYDVYRYSNIAGVTYTPSKYVNVGDELDMVRYGHLPCMPYMGEGFRYKYGKIPNATIVITTNDFGYLRVFKDGTEVSGSPFTVSGGAKYVNVGFSETGSYYAYLCNMSSGNNTMVSAKCHWTVES